MIELNHNIKIPSIELELGTRRTSTTQSETSEEQSPQAKSKQEVTPLPQPRREGIYAVRKKKLVEL